MGPEISDVYDQQCKDSSFLIENYIPGQPVKSGNHKFNRSHKRSLKASKSSFKAHKIFDISKEPITFEEMLPMHKMWNFYIDDLIGNEKAKPTILQKMSKADFHGALISIFESKNQALIGLEGIIVKESRFTFTLV